MIDDTTLDKPYASKIMLVTLHWSSKHVRVVRGINLISLVWTNNSCWLPCELRIYNKANDGWIRVFWTVDINGDAECWATSKLEFQRLQSGISWFETKTSIIRSVIRQYLVHPTISLDPCISFKIIVE